MVGGATAEEIVDRQIVDQTLADIQQFVNLESAIRDGSPADDDPYWRGAYEDLTQLLAEHAAIQPEVTRSFFSVIGATALAFAADRYGPDEMHPKLYSGAFEHNVLATYHHAGHPTGMTRNMFRYAQLRNQRYPGTYNSYNFLRFAIIGPFHDVIIGNGRLNDERQSAMLADDVYADALLGIGVQAPQDTEIINGILSTAWDVQARRQAFNSKKEHFLTQQAACVGDLFPLFERRGVYEALCLVPEDFSKHMNNRIFVQEAEEAGITLEGMSVDDCMRFIDERPDLQAHFREFLIGQEKFFRTFVAADPEMDSYFPGVRQDSARFIGRLLKDYQPERRTPRLGTLDTHGVLLRAREYMLEAA